MGRREKREEVTRERTELDVRAEEEEEERGRKEQQEVP